jgi:3-isopropylmalate/(R)-2-methylmalate dehydratase small subunit
MLWRAARRPHVAWPGRRFAGALLMGWGGFNVIEGLVDHVILGSMSWARSRDGGLGLGLHPIGIGLFHPRLCFETPPRGKASLEAPSDRSASAPLPQPVNLLKGASNPRKRAGPEMEKFTKLTGVAAPLPIMNVDTDMIIPKQYLKTIARTGLGKGLFSEMRYRDDGSDNPDFILNKPAYRGASILVAGDNFGCGSSREHAPWALLDYGLRCIISTSFADIFYNNCFKNGILPIKVSQAELDKLMDDASRGANATLTVDLEAQEIRGPDGGVVKFDIDPFRKHCLLNGLDDIGLTLQKADKIDSFERAAAQSRPWA